MQILAIWPESSPPPLVFYPASQLCLVVEVGEERTCSLGAFILLDFCHRLSHSVQSSLTRKEKNFGPHVLRTAFDAASK